MSTAQKLKELHGDDIDSMARDVFGSCIESDYDNDNEIHIYWFEDQSSISFARDWSVATVHV